ncbi:hypothetical protein X928_06820 [Petrotoga miotherma DSM 10691]|uniref:Tripartite ATP-independent periplasmic transporters DctQ component domain-containing protein n=1 Tax=Petrotoga miotherma DSM 10691 TaxID=1434326 RepID=A0A2K1P9Y6_9BACT|nr:TRAP transporter small permease [Petrotoga miotherma]PNR99600.1 hypothetical protein X928_06820 [Petrotoga miotherma DSM 10691]
MHRFFERVDKIFFALLGAALLFNVVITFSQVVARYVFNSPLVWQEEMSGVTMIYLVVVGTTWGIRKSIHISISVVSNFLFKKIPIIPDILEILGYIAYSILAIIYGFQLSDLTKFQTLPTLGIKQSYIYGVIPISGFIMLYFVFEKIFELWKSKKEGDKI